MKCKFWDRLPGQYNEQCQCDGEIPLSSHAVLGDGWRDARKELPEKPDRYLVFLDDNQVWVGIYVNGIWVTGNMGNVMYWKCLPDPPYFA